MAQRYSTYPHAQDSGLDNQHCLKIKKALLPTGSSHLEYSHTNSAAVKIRKDSVSGTDDKRIPPALSLRNVLTSLLDYIQEPESYP